MNQKDFEYKLRLYNWLSFQLIIPIVILGIELVIRVLAGDEHYSFFFKSQKLTLIAVLLYLNIASIVVVDEMFIRNTNKTVSQNSIIHYLKSIVSTFGLIVIYVFLISLGTNIYEEDFSKTSFIFSAGTNYVIASSLIYLGIIGAAYTSFNNFLLENVN